MARVTREQVTEYQTLSDQLEATATSALRAVLASIDLTDETTWAQVLEIVRQVFGAYGNGAAELGATWYAQCRDAETDGQGAYAPQPYLDGKLYHRVTKATEKALQDLRDGIHTADETTYAIGNIVGDFIATANRGAVQENLNRENESPVKSGRTRTQIQKEKGYRKKTGRVKFMRVPRAGCSCSFCITMASRGAVYRTRETAGGGDEMNRYHRDCRCSIVPVEGDDPIIDGYGEEIDAYYDQYAAAYDKLGDLWRANRDGGLTGDDLELMERIEAARKRHEERQAVDDNVPDWRPINEVSIVMRWMYHDMT